MIAALLSVGLALGGAAPAEGARQFDLICKGTTRTAAGNPKAPEQWAWHLSVDLYVNRWCGRDSGCSVVYRIANTRSDVIQLAHQPTYYDDLEILFVPSTNRMAWSYDYNAQVTYLSEGTCTPAPFSKFPSKSKLSEETRPELEAAPGAK